jgi:hypothetical protein
VPESVLVGETAAALHAGHRVSMDGDPRSRRPSWVPDYYASTTI